MAAIARTATTPTWSPTELDDATLVDVSCGGARTDAVLRSQVLESERRVLPPQIDAVSADTDLITVGLGANDGGFVVTTVFGCLAMAPSDPRGSPCKDAFAKKIPRLLDRIRTRYVDVLEAIGHRAPNARILVVGYPRLLADSKGCPRRFPLAKGDVDYVREAFDRLIDTIEAAAAEAGVEYVDVAAASEGHDICSDEPWINGRRDDRANRCRGVPPDARRAGGGRAVDPRPSAVASSESRSVNKTFS